MIFHLQLKIITQYIVTVHLSLTVEEQKRL